MRLARPGDGDIVTMAAHAVWRMRRAIAQAPLLLLVPATLLIAALTAPLGVLVPLLAWLVRHSWNYEAELTELYGRDSPELDDIAR
ncbi:hypothetical protein [Novosphingobium sp. PP1Y]|uniref:hypothetical protein n=1 Tax=Novosphingobium sp. PP1Y TaxID=702113 RepID=UPI0005A1157C|nr:hypothetical protein [Novosphingobium sp. PP1Y]